MDKLIHSLNLICEDSVDSVMNCIDIYRIRLSVPAAAAIRDQNLNDISTTNHFQKYLKMNGQ